MSLPARCCFTLLALFGGCRDATQVSFDITTDIPCTEVGKVAISAGLEGETEKAEPVAVERSCSENGTVRAIGSYAVKPKGQNLVASFKAVLAADPMTDVSECTATRGYARCIVARRRISFVPQRGLIVPVALRLICKGVQCDENSTCNRLGRCVSSVVDTEACEGDVCDKTETTPGDGLSCFNEVAPPLFCKDEQPWCTRDASGQRACAEAPAPTGESFECRTGAECGPNRSCVEGDAGVLGRCAPRTDAGIVLCQPSDPKACPFGASDCRFDAGSGFLQCASTRPWVPPDGGLDPRCAEVLANPDGPGDQQVYDCALRPGQLKLCTVTECSDPVACFCTTYVKVAKDCTEATCAGFQGGTGCSSDDFFILPPFRCSGDPVPQSACMIRYLLKNNVCSP